jgi:hypothetical protein
MTENTDNSQIDTEQLAECMEQYREADSRERKREIENRVLAETVWKTRSQAQTEKAKFSQSELEVIHSAVTDDALEAKRLLRRNSLNR